MKCIGVRLGGGGYKLSLNTGPVLEVQKEVNGGQTFGGIIGVRLLFFWGGYKPTMNICPVMEVHDEEDEGQT